MTAFNFLDLRAIDKLSKLALSKRIHIETKLMASVLNSAVATMSFYYHYESNDDDEKQKLSYQTIALIESNLTYLESQISQLLRDFYDDTLTEAGFKGEVRSLFLSLMVALSISKNLAKHGMLISDLGDDVDLADLRMQNYKDESDNDMILEHIYSKMRGKRTQGILAKKEYWGNLGNSISDFMNALQLIHNEAVAKYFGRLLDKIFKADKRVEKNSLIDFQFLEYYPQYKIITFDEDLTASLESFDNDHYNYLRDLQSRLKNV